MPITEKLREKHIGPEEHFYHKIFHHGRAGVGLIALINCGKLLKAQLDGGLQKRVRCFVDAYLRELAQLDQLLAKKKGAALRVLSFPQLSQSEQLTQYANTWQSAAPQLSYKASDPLLQATIQLRLEELPAIYAEKAVSCIGL